MFPAALAFCGGAAAVQWLPALLPVPACVLLAPLALLALRSRPATAAFCVGATAASLIIGQRLSADWPCARDREEIAVTGVVATPAIRREGRVDFDLAVTRSDGPGRLPEIVRLSWYDATDRPRPGQRWRMRVRLRCRQGLANPGAPDRELDLLRQHIGATGYAVASSPPEQLDDGVMRRPIERLRARVAGGIERALPDGPSRSVLQGLSVGMRATVPDELWQAFAITGVAHLMAISGLHVTGCALSVLLLLRAAWRWMRLPQASARVPIELAAVVSVTAGYAFLAGGSVPALRTLAMVAIVTLQRLLRRQVPVHATLALAAMLLCAADPLALSSAGFWLSFVATAALLTVLEDGRGWRARLGLFMRNQASVMALLTPVTAHVFGRLSLVAPLANAIAIPAFGCLLLPAVLSGTVVELVREGAGSGIWRLINQMLDATWPLLTAMARWPFAGWAPAAQPVALVAGAGLLTLAALLLPLRGIRIASAAALLALACGEGAGPAPGAWTLTVLDVGQGLAVVAETHRHVLVFDTGPSWRGSGAAARVSLLPYLRARGIRRIDLMIVSHPDMDHAGGVRDIGNAVAVARRIDGGVGDSVAPDRRCLRGDQWSWDGVDFRVLHPPAGMPGSENDRSCALRISGAGGSALLLADVEADGEREIGPAVGPADVVLLPHHGSRSSSTPELVAGVRARLGIASAGYGNRWGMPAREVVARWRSAGTTVLTTAQAGAVTVRFAAGPRPIEVVTERASAPHWWRRS